jgi:O-antigen/teichoic acid export membrane protein
MRHWKTFSTSFATLSARLSVTAGLLISNGIAARRMTPEQFGLWSILLNLNLLTNGFDFGFRFTLGNRLAALGSRGVEAEEERRETFLTILFLQAAIAATGMLLVLFVFPVAPWARWFKITDPLLVAQVHHLMPIVMALMIGSLPVALMWTVFFGYQEIKLASFLSGAGTILQTVVFVVSAYRCKFAWIIVIYFAFNLVSGFLLTSYVFVRRRWRFTLVPSARAFAIIRSLFRVSFHAFILGVCAIISQILGPIISGLISGLGAAGDFALIQKLFSFLTTAHIAILAPVSPAVSLESHSGNWDAVRRRLRVCVFQVWPVIFLVGGAAVWCAHPVLIRAWAGHWLTEYPLAALLLLWACLTGFVNTFSVFLNSLGLVKVQAALSIAMLLPSLVLPALLSRWLGVPGIALSMVLCAIPAAIIWPSYTRRALRLHLLRV